MACAYSHMISGRSPWPDSAHFTISSTEGYIGQITSVAAWSRYQFHSSAPS
jgi:hypothetical protein